MDTIYNPIKIAEVSNTPATPSPGFLVLYAKTDGNFYYLDPNGIEYPMVIPSGVVSGSSQLKTINSESVYGSGNITISGSGYQSTEIDVLLCTTPKRSGKFNITGSFSGNSITPKQIAGVYLNKGTLSDEAEMDSINISAVITSPSTSVCYWNSRTTVKGYFKISY